MLQEKRVNIITKDGNGMMRVSASKAAEFVANGNYVYTTKGKLKSFLNFQGKLGKNQKVIKSSFDKTINELGKKDLRLMPSGKIHHKGTNLIVGKITKEETLEQNYITPNIRFDRKGRVIVRKWSTNIGYSF